MLFPKLPKAKPPKAAPVLTPTLFPDDQGGTSLIATFGGAVEYGPDQALGPIREHSRYSVKSERLLSEAKNAA